jgi:hypothetical protein
MAVELHETWGDLGGAGVGFDIPGGGFVFVCRQGDPDDPGYPGTATDADWDAARKLAAFVDSGGLIDPPADGPTFTVEAGRIKARAGTFELSCDHFGRGGVKLDGWDVEGVTAVTLNVKAGAVPEVAVTVLPIPALSKAKPDSPTCRTDSQPSAGGR